MLEGSEVLVEVHGSFVVDLDDGVSKTSVLLADLTKGRLLRPASAHTPSYKDNCVPLTMASEGYKVRIYENVKRGWLHLPSNLLVNVSFPMTQSFR